MRDYSIGDIIQITDEKHARFPCLLIISDVKQWGVIAYITIPKSNDGSERVGTVKEVRLSSPQPIAVWFDENEAKTHGGYWFFESDDELEIVEL